MTKDSKQLLDSLIIAGREFRSRLLVGTGKFSSAATMRLAVDASRSQLVTVALRRVDLDNPQDDMLTALQGGDFLIFPNTSGARDAEEAVRLARLARASGLEPWIKLEVTPDPRYLLPDPVETLIAAQILIKERVEFFAEKYGFDYGRIAVKNQRSRWGS